MIQVKDIKELREHADCSQWQLSNATGIERSKISLMENGYVTPKPSELAAIEKVLLEEISRQKARLERVMESRAEVGHS
jgi:predicted transcriptional regulator